MQLNTIRPDSDNTALEIWASFAMNYCRQRITCYQLSKPTLCRLHMANLQVQILILVQQSTEKMHQ